MAYHLQMDGIDDKLVSASVTFTKIIMDVLIDHKSATAQMYADYRPSIGFTAFYRDTANNDKFDSINSVKIDGVSKTTGTLFVPTNTRHIMEIEDGTGTGAITFFSHNTNVQYVKGNIYDIKFYNGTTLVAHYDMTIGEQVPGTVQDQSGNGRHATLTGGTWVIESGGTTYNATVGSASITPTGALDTIYAVSQTVGNATLTPSGTLSRVITFAETVGEAIIQPIGIIVKQISKGVGNSIVTPIGNASKGIFQTVGQGIVNAAGTLSTLLNPPIINTAKRTMINWVMKGLKNFFD